MPSRSRRLDRDAFLPSPFPQFSSTFHTIACCRFVLQALLISCGAPLPEGLRSCRLDVRILRSSSWLLTQCECMSLHSRPHRYPKAFSSLIHWLRREVDPSKLRLLTSLLRICLTASKQSRE